MLFADPAQLEFGRQIRGHFRGVEGAEGSVQLTLLVHFLETTGIGNSPRQCFLQLAQRASTLKKQGRAIGAYAYLELRDILFIANGSQAALEVEHLSYQPRYLFLDDDLVPDLLDQGRAYGSFQPP